MKGLFSLVGATVVGFLGVLTLHSPSSQSVPVSKVTSPTSSSSPQQPPSGSTTTTTVGVPSSNVNGNAVGQLENYSFGQMAVKVTIRSEEHTSELQSLRHLVCRL